MQLAHELDEFERSLNILANQATHLQNFIRGSCRQVECSSRRGTIMYRGSVRHVTSSGREHQPALDYGWPSRRIYSSITVSCIAS